MLERGAGVSGAAITGAGLVLGLPVGVILAMPAQALRPEGRAVGMGLFYTWLYIGNAALPPAAGWPQDGTGSAAAPLFLTTLLVAAMLPLYVLFQAILQGRTAAGPRSAGA